MRKPFVEIYTDPGQIPWRPVQGRPGVYEKILNESPDGRRNTRLIKVEPGVEITAVRTIDCWEEGFVVKGEFTLTAVSQSVTEGMYICRPPGGYHGPAKANTEVVVLLFGYRD